MKYRKKPIVIEAIQNNTREDAEKMSLQWGENFDNVVIFDEDNDEIVHSIGTLEGHMKADKGDWIIKGVNGEFYPIKNDIFEKSYEKAE